MLSISSELALISSWFSVNILLSSFMYDFFARSSFLISFDQQNIMFRQQIRDCFQAYCLLIFLQQSDIYALFSAENNLLIKCSTAMNKQESFFIGLCIKTQRRDGQPVTALNCVSCVLLCFTR